MDLIEEYFFKLGIYPISKNEITNEQLNIAINYKSKDYFDNFYLSGLDVVQERLELDIQKVLYFEFYNYFKTLKIDSVLEPCCASGILGNFINANFNNINYLGLDINKYAISNANKHSKLLGLKSNFRNLDIYSFNDKVDIIIGRYFLNKLDKSFDQNLFEHLTKLSNIFLCILNLRKSSDIKIYESKFKSFGYKFQELSKPLFSKSTDGIYQLIFAFKE